MNFKSYLLLPLLLLMATATTTLQAQCEDWVEPSATTGWTDFNTAFGGAPCDDGTGCPFNEIQDFEVFASEAYSVDGFIAGGEYAFSMCNGPGAGAWVPEFTIIAPSGAIDAFGAGDGDACTITWTASEDGTYFIVINEADNCGGGPNIGTANGFPALSCNSGASCPPVVDACSAGILTTNGEVTVCGTDGTFDLLVEMDSDTIPTGGGLVYTFGDQLGGTGGLAGGFTLTGVSNMETYDSDINGVLSSNGLPVLMGQWVIKSAARDAAGEVCSTSVDSLIVNFVDGPAIDEILSPGDGTATVVVSGGGAPFTYEWSDGQTTETAIDLPDGDYTVTVTATNGCTTEGMVTVIFGMEQEDVCNAGTLVTNGEVAVCGDAATFDLLVEMDTIPMDGDLVYTFDDSFGGTGGLAGGFTLTGVSNMESYNSDVNGVMSGNGLAALGGTWVIKAAMRDGDAAVCSISMDSLIVNFGALVVIDAIVDNGDGTATVTASGGTAPFTYEWSDGQTTETAIDLVNGDYSVIVTDAIGCTQEAMVTVMVSAVDNIESLEALTISPNPTTDGRFLVDVQLNDTHNLEVSILDVTGRVITQQKRQTSGERLSFDLSTQAAGIYLVRIQVGQESLYRRVVLTK